MNRWYLRYFLKSCLMFNNEIQIGSIKFYKDGNFNFSSMEVDAVSEESAVEKGKQLLIAALGSINIITEQQIPFTLIDAQQMSNSNGSCEGSSYQDAEICIACNFPIEKNEEINSIFEISLKDKNVYKVLELLNNPQCNDWVNLYRIYEVINSDINVVKAGWTTNGLVNDFKHTANNPQVLGKESRHGASKQKPPKTPMDIKDARKFIKSILGKWIQCKKFK